MNIFHFVKVRFDIRRADITQDWLDSRYLFFRKHTLVSLLKQTNQNWILWIQCQDGMQDKIALLSAILEATKNVNEGFQYIITFGDDPVSYFTKGLSDEKAKEFVKSDYVYVTRIDSDDLYGPRAIEICASVQPQSKPRQVEASMFRRGYLHSLLSGKLGTYVSPSTPFHTLMIPGEVYRDEKEYYTQVWNKTGDHSRINSEFRVHVLPDYQFTVLIHDKNFISDFEYARDKTEFVNRNWDIKQFYDNPVVFDVDDFCDEMNCLDELMQLKQQYPNFACTLFTIPHKTSTALLRKAKSLGFIELAVHGITHSPNEELKSLKQSHLDNYFKELDFSLYARGFRAPGWYIEEQHVKACVNHGMWIALHTRHVPTLRPHCSHGYYACGERYDYWHGHTHNVCNNWLKGHLPSLLVKWNKDQIFHFVSDAILVKPN